MCIVLYLSMQFNVYVKTVWPDNKSAVIVTVAHLSTNIGWLINNVLSYKIVRFIQQRSELYNYCIHFYAKHHGSWIYAKFGIKICICI